MPRKRNRNGTRSYRNICSYDFVLLTKQSPSVRLRVSDCNEDFYISEDNGMSEKTENYFRIRIRHNDPCRLKKTGCQIIRGQPRPFSAIVYKVHHTYVRITSCYLQNNPRLLNYMWLTMMGIFHNRRYRHERKGWRLQPFSGPNRKSTEHVFGRVCVLCKTIPIC